MFLDQTVDKVGAVALICSLLGKQVFIISLVYLEGSISHGTMKHSHCRQIKYLCSPIQSSPRTKSRGCGILFISS